MARRLTTSQLREAYGNRCAAASELVRLTVCPNTGAKTTIHKLAAPAFAEAHRIMHRHGWHPPASSTGAMNCRPITGGTKLSLHSFGIAADYDWNRNPYRRRPDGVDGCDDLVRAGLTNMPCAMVDDIKAIALTDGTPVFRWGGDYRSNVDAMHWENVIHPDDLDRFEVDPTTTGDDVTEQDIAAIVDAVVDDVTDALVADDKLHEAIATAVMTRPLLGSGLTVEQVLNRTLKLVKEQGP